MRYTPPKITRIVSAGSAIRSVKGAPVNEIVGGLLTAGAAYQADE
jgi:hypothetical protein